MSEWIRVFAPASVANVGPGFDVLGFAVSRPGDIVEVRKRRTPGVVITDIRYIRKQDIGKLPQNPKKKYRRRRSAECADDVAGTRRGR